MTNEELLEKIGQRFIEEREVTRGIIQEEVKKTVEVIVEEKLEPIRKNLDLLKKGSRKTNKTLDLVARFQDQEVITLRKRVTHIGDYLGIPNPTSML